MVKSTRKNVRILCSSLLILGICIACVVKLNDVKQQNISRMIETAKNNVTLDLTAGIEEKEILAYRIEECRYEESSEYQSKPCNVVCRYQVTYAGAGTRMFTAQVERLFSIVREKQKYVAAEEAPCTISEDSAEKERETQKICSWIGKDAFIPTVKKSEVKNKTKKEIAELLLTKYLESLKSFSQDRTFRIMEYRDVKVLDLYETKGETYRNSEAYTPKIKEQNAEQSWYLEEEFSYRYAGYMTLYGWCGRAFPGYNDAEAWFETPLQDTTFYLIEHAEDFCLMNTESISNASI